MLSNRYLAVVALILIVGTFGEGVLYNRPAADTAIYSLQDPTDIEVTYRGKLALRLNKNNSGSWTVTSPFNAPAITSRVELLLDSNEQSARSYPLQKVQSHNGPGASSFSDPVALKVDGLEFLIGDIEPVSQLRFVAAKNRVYLQADHIVPLLQSPKATFTDLNISGKVDSVDIAYPDQKLAHTRQSDLETSITDKPSHWSNLQALGVVDASLLDTPTFGSVTLTLDSGKKQLFHLYHLQQHGPQYGVLRPANAAFAYLLNSEQTTTLGICVYC